MDRYHRYGPISPIWTDIGHFVPILRENQDKRYNDNYKPSNGHARITCKYITIMHVLSQRIAEVQQQLNKFEEHVDKQIKSANKHLENLTSKR